jgi:small subunit ribosomal protein S20
MANHKSALKKHKRDEKKRVINKMNRSKMKNKVKLLTKDIKAGNLDDAKLLHPKVMSIIDKTITKGTIHCKTGSRYKSRLTLLLRKSEAEV